MSKDELTSAIYHRWDNTTSDVFAKDVEFVSPTPGEGSASSHNVPYTWPVHRPEPPWNDIARSLEATAVSFARLADLVERMINRLEEERENG